MKIFSAAIIMGAVLASENLLAEPLAPRVAGAEPVHIERYGLSMKAPLGWEVKDQIPGLSLLFQELRKDSEPVYDRPTFQRNITVSIQKEAEPMSDAYANMLKAKIQETFGKNTSITNYEVAKEHKFFDHHGKNDAMMVYASYYVGEIAMSQLHVILQGEHNRALITYTDLASEMENDKGAFQAAWDSINSLDIQGEPAPLYQQMIIPSLCLLGLVLILGLFILSTKKNSKKLLRDDYDSEEAASAISAIDSDIKSISKPMKAKKKRLKSEPETMLPTGISWS